MSGDNHDTGATNLAFARRLVGELRASGVTSAAVCPGSRSTPLALALAEQPGLACSYHVDERSAAFYALGYAKAAGRPVALLCTSGTAGANFLPAVAEAHHSRVPLIVMTADRPPELRSWGAAQTMEQRSLFAGFLRWFEEAPCPSERSGQDAYAAALAWRAVCAATGLPPGPVHLNLPFREPLVPKNFEPRQAPARSHAARLMQGLPAADTAPAEGLAGQFRGISRGVLLFGPGTWDEDLAPAACALAEALDWPVIADPASGLRAGTPVTDAVIHGADLLLRDAATAASLSPEVIVRFGGQPTSGSLNAWLARHAPADVWLVDEAAAFRDPQHRATRMFRASPRPFCEMAAASPAARASDPAWRGEWRRLDAVARAVAAGALASQDAFLTPHLAAALWARLPDGAALYVANSMAVRDVDAFAGPRHADLRLLANRGVNGIDGLVSCALGAAAAKPVPTVLWCGDLAYLHDVSGLLAGQLLGADLTVVVSNDDGGGIFEYLPIAASIPRPLFEQAFAMPHGTDLCQVARGFGWQATLADSAPSFEQALARALEGGRHVIEVPVDRAANTAFHRALAEQVGAALQRARRS
jgi:2-succinyl-5-enolpyruvyl-6-hydroxy-3-cyclohexene-1-carboxylate synthase